MLRCDLKLPVDILYEHSEEEHTSNSTECANSLLEKIERVHRFASKHLKLSSQMKRNYDRRATPDSGFLPGDNAWLYNPQR